jgi:protein SCO1/2
MTASSGVLQRAGAGLESRAAALSGRPAFWLVLIGLLASWPLVWSLRHPAPPPPPVLGQVPPFRLVDELGKPFGSEDLRGLVWVAGMVSSRCDGTCAAVAATMGRIQGRMRQLAPAFRLVAFTVAPGHDTPELLRGLARAHHANPRTWTFLGGSPDEVRRTLVDGLHAQPDPGPGTVPGELFHGPMLVLVDAQGQRRGAYDSASPASVDALVRDAALLINRRR